MEAKTLTLVDELGQHCGCYSDRDQHHHCVACRAIDALEAAERALKPFAEAHVSSAAVAMLGRDAQRLRCSAFTTLGDFEFARSVRDKIKGGAE